jgi:hypothetical protein
MRKNTKFNLYINSDNKRIWNIIEDLKHEKVDISSYLCSKIIEGYEKDNHHPMSEPIVKAPIKEKNHLIYDLAEIAKEAEENGIDGHDISYVLPHMYSNSEISKDDMTDLVSFIVKLYLTVVNTNEIKKIILANPDKFPNTKKDIDTKYRINEFKKLLNLELFDDIDRKVLYDEQKKKEEMEERNIKMIELNRQKLQIERQQWEHENPGREFWTKGMSDEEIETSNKLLSGEWEIVTTDSYEPDETSTFI